ncbi:MAG: S1C family serine protease [bacterium]|nr:S1C family serine protease [bacterium]
MKPRNALIAGTLAVLVATFCFVYVQKKIENTRKDSEQANVILTERVLELEDARVATEKEKAEMNLQIGFLLYALGENVGHLTDQNTNLADQNDDLRDELNKLREDFESYKNCIVKIYGEAGYLTHLMVDYSNTKEPTKKARSCLSGSIIRYEGNTYILTAGHLDMAGYTVSKITATFNFGVSTQEAEIVGYDHSYDVMLLKFKDPNFKYEGYTPGFADKDSLKVGHRVVAMGSPLCKPFVLSVGCIGKIYRDSPATRDLLMHNALINPGNSGGPLLNEDGQIVGINTMVTGDPVNNFVSAMGIAVSVRSILEVMPELIRGQKN